MSDTAIAQSIAPFESASELREAHALLLEKLDSHIGEDASSAGETAALARLESEIRQFLERGAATGVYLEEMKERTACQILLDYWLSNLAQAGLPAGSARLARFDGTQLPDLKTVHCPYVGLEAFRAEDQTYFFGRESDTKALQAQVRETPLVVVLGASGSGKSSLVMGGVLPALADEEPALRIVPPFVPGNAVLDHLVGAVLQSRGGTGGDIASEVAALRQDPSRLLALIGGEEAPPTLITVDQFEEVFTLSSAEDREALVASLARLLEAGRGHRVILTVREEFRSRIVELRALSPYLDKAWCSMRPMGYDELRAAVEKPAALVNLQFQAGIVDDLVKKVLGQPAALPLLQFTLRLLWDKRDRNRITWEVYRRTGDPLNALKASADQFYDGLATENQNEVKRVLLELVRVDELLEAYRQPVPRSRLLQAGRANTEEVLEELARKDYVRITGSPGAADPIVEVKHESLIRNWPRLVGWIDQKRIAQRQRLSLSQAARRWKEEGKPSKGLLTGWQLEEAKGHSDLSALEEDFIRASERKQKNQLHRAYAALVAILIAALMIAGFAYYFRNEAERLSNRAALLDKQQKETAQALAEVQAKYSDLSSRFAKGVQQATKSQPVTIFLHISTKEQLPRAEEIAEQLRQNGIKVPGIQKVSGVTSSSFRYFRREDESEAQKIVQLLNTYLAVRVPIKPRLIEGVESKVPGKQYEIWFAPNALDSSQGAITEPKLSADEDTLRNRQELELQLDRVTREHSAFRDRIQELEPALDRLTTERNDIRSDFDSCTVDKESAERRLGLLEHLAVPPSFMVLEESSVQHLSLGQPAGIIAIGAENLEDDKDDARYYVWTSNPPEPFRPNRDRARQLIASSGGATCSAESAMGRSCYVVRRSDLALNKQLAGEFVVGGLRYGIRATRWDNSSGGKADRLSLVVYALAPR